MSERDLTQKIELRRAFWAMGASTRLDVKLSALVPRQRSRTRADAEEWTDLDVLAVEYSVLAGLSYGVADCKTLKGRVAERVFWLRGVADLFAARTAYLTRDEALPASARQLALRLGIAALDAKDRAQLVDQIGTARLPVAGQFLERSTFERWNQLVGTAPRAVERLQRYRRTIYWLAPRHRNLTYLPGQLELVRDALDPRQPWAVALVVDLAWLYLIALLAALDDITRLHLTEPAVGLRYAVLGSEQEARDKEFLAERLRTILASHPASRGRPIDVNVLPPYYEGLGELLGRLARRRSDAVGALRALEFTGVETIAGDGSSWAQAFPASSPFEAKLASDVIRFLVTACQIDRGFVARFDKLTTNGSSEIPSRTDTRVGDVSVPEAVQQTGLFDGPVTHETPASRDRERI